MHCAIVKRSISGTEAFVGSAVFCQLHELLFAWGSMNNVKLGAKKASKKFDFVSLVLSVLLSCFGHPYLSVSGQTIFLATE